MRLIDADALEQMLEIDFELSDVIERIKDHINSEPTVDALPVVRCADCKYWVEDDHGSILGKCDYTKQGTPSFQFCAYGERRE